jgi:hypothetical protein
MENNLEKTNKEIQLTYLQTGSNSAKVITTVEGIQHEIYVYVCTAWQSQRIDQIRNEVMAELTKE